MDQYGILSVSNLSEKEKEHFYEYIQRIVGNPVLEFVQHFLGNDSYLKFLDIVAGTSFKMPSHKILQRELGCVRIFGYVSGRKYSEDAVKSAAKIYKKSAGQIKKSTVKVVNMLGVEDSMSKEEIMNYLKYVSDNKDKTQEV